MSDQTITKVCLFEGCGREVAAKGFCDPHYRQQKKGAILSPIKRMRPKGSPPRIEYDEVPCPNPNLRGPCHVWKGNKIGGGYGQVAFEGKPILVHRYVWGLANGPIPDGMMIDHQCRNMADPKDISHRACCNVDHLRVVTAKVNSTENAAGMSWQLLAAKTHCKYGHPFDEANTLRYKRSRYCRTCHRIRVRDASRQKRAAQKLERGNDESTRSGTS